jgi:hypothetical protein
VADQGVALGGEPFEAGGVVLAGVDGEQIPRRSGAQNPGRFAGCALRLEGAAEVGDVRLEGARGPRRRLLSPELVDETVEGPENPELHVKKG